MDTSLDRCEKRLHSHTARAGNFAGCFVTMKCISHSDPAKKACPSGLLDPGIPLKPKGFQLLGFLEFPTTFPTKAVPHLILEDLLRLSRGACTNRNPPAFLRMGELTLKTRIRNLTLIGLENPRPI